MKRIIYSLTLLAAALAAPTLAQADISILIGIAPPALPMYAQPPIPGDGYLWTPGYWSWNAADNDYYWVPGTWVVAPFVGALWTPGYWAWRGNGYAWDDGYWGTHIGYYGGINYGFGYGGVGYQGGYWNNGAFSYNRSVNNVSRSHITNVYNSTVNITRVNRISYNGGQGGIRLQPTQAEASIARMPHNGLTAPQTQHEQGARSNAALRASVNHGVPKVAATPVPGAFNEPNVTAARAAQAQRVSRAQAASAQQSQARPQQRNAAPQQPSRQVMPRPQPAAHPAPPQNMRQQAGPAEAHKNAPRQAHPGKPDRQEK